MVTGNLGGRGNLGDKMSELFTEVLLAGFIYQKEKIGLSLLGKTSSVKGE